MQSLDVVDARDRRVVTRQHNRMRFMEALRPSALNRLRGNGVEQQKELLPLLPLRSDRSRKRILQVLGVLAHTGVPRLRANMLA